ncbi:MAG: NRDE family protein [Phycisphaeraceae bacterium]
MCTVTIVPNSADSAGFRMACSRDEQHGRLPARPPQPHTIGGLDALMPIDPVSNGTWVGVNTAGLALTLLNYNLPDPPTGRDASRGAVIPALLGARSVHEVIQSLKTIERERMMPFRLVACDGDALLIWRSTDPVERVVLDPWQGEPVMFTSSGLGDHLVEPPRRELFNGWFSEGVSSYLEAQHAFHRHRWPDREHLSVCMNREDARTVSYTTVDVHPQRVTMAYHPDRPDREAHGRSITLQRKLAPR